MPSITVSSLKYTTFETYFVPPPFASIQSTQLDPVHFIRNGTIVLLHLTRI